MVIRVFRARVFDGKQKELERFFREKAVPVLKAQKGLISVTIGTPRAETPNELLMISTWENLDAVKGFTGEKWQIPVIDPDEADLVKEAFVDHYEHAEL